MRTPQARITLIPFASGWITSRSRVSDPSQLAEMQRDLDAAGVRKNGVEEDPETHRQYISFYDPDGIAWELYAVSTRPTA
jgi:glyoxylase I family protein